MAHHHKLDCLVKRLDCSVVVVVKVKVTEKVQNSSESSSRQYLLICWTVCNQTWYGDYSLWAIVLCKKIGLLSFKFRAIVKVHIIKYDCFYHIYLTADLYASTFNWMVHHHKLECFVSKLDCCFQGQDHSEGSELYWIFLYLICTTDVFSTKEGVLIYYL